jgi:hypothetical protein
MQIDATLNKLTTVCTILDVISICQFVYFIGT